MLLKGDCTPSMTEVGCGPENRPGPHSHELQLSPSGCECGPETSGPCSTDGRWSWWGLGPVTQLRSSGYKVTVRLRVVEKYSAETLHLDRKTLKDIVLCSN